MINRVLVKLFDICVQCLWWLPTWLVAVKRPENFDADWYCASYPDVKGLHPFTHFILFGFSELRDPSPWYSLSGAKYLAPVSRFNWLVRCLGARKYSTEWHGGHMAAGKHTSSVIVVAHQVNSQVYGAELSLLRLVQGLAANNVDCYVILPSALNPTYVAAMRAVSTQIAYVPMRWFSSSRCVDTKAIELLGRLYEDCPANKILVNTSVLWEPVLAANQLGYESFVHVREYYPADDGLCDVLSAKPTEIVAHLEALDTRLLVNSGFTAGQFSASTNVVPNIVDIQAVGLSDRNCHVMRVGMLSSNVAKKGVEDFFLIASLLKAHSDIEFYLYGPQTSLVDSLSTQFGSVVQVMGYQEVDEALANIDVVLNLSHFAESFGRTIAEAMAAKKVAIGYDFGAISELIQHGKTGFLVEYRQVEKVANLLIDIFDDFDLRQLVGESAAEFVSQNLSEASVVAKFLAVTGLNN